jgi:hypothetical protein
MNWFVLDKDLDLEFIGFFDNYYDALDSAKEDSPDIDDVISELQVESWIEEYDRAVKVPEVSYDFADEL